MQPPDPSNELRADQQTAETYFSLLGELARVTIVEDENQLTPQRLFKIYQALELTFDELIHSEDLVAISEFHNKALQASKSLKRVLSEHTFIELPPCKQKEVKLAQIINRLAVLESFKIFERVRAVGIHNEIYDNDNNKNKNKPKLSRPEWGNISQKLIELKTQIIFNHILGFKDDQSVITPENRDSISSGLVKNIKFYRGTIKVSAAAVINYIHITRLGDPVVQKVKTTDIEQYAFQELRSIFVNALMISINQHLNEKVYSKER